MARTTARGLHLLVLGAMVAGLLAGCGAEAAATGGKKTVLTTFTVLADMARNVAGDKLVVESIIKPGAEIHEYDPTPQDVARARRANLILNNGLNLEAWFERFYTDVRSVPSTVLSEGVAPIPIGEGSYTGKPNPHAWMSPVNAVIYVENIRKAFVALDPPNAATYDANARAYTEKIRAIDGTLRTNLDRLPANQRALVSCEGAFSYLTRDYDMREIFLWAVNSDEEGTPQQVRKVVDAVRRDRVPAVFCESTVNDSAQRQVAQETGARYAGQLYVDSLTDAKGEAPTYLKMLEYDTNAIAKGLLGT